MQIDLDGRTAFVTGGASGIGRAIVEALLAAGARVAFTFSSSREAAEDIVAKAPKGRARALFADLKEADAAKLAVGATNATFGTIDIAVANAGGLIQRSRVSDCSLELWNEAMALNLTSAFLTARAVIPQMIEARSGAIVLMSSLAAHDGGGMGAAHYAASKGGVSTLSRALAKELGPDGIRVNAVAPGLIGTQFHDRFSTAEGRKATVDRTPLRREGQPEDVANAVLYLVSPMSSFLAGEIIEVNGGVGAF
ncbi:MAG TPA: SDR family oxidoreductase [Kaistia sp.]|nr:SDR family oxidoreductase [Kaistia sp.]